MMQNFREQAEKISKAILLAKEKRTYRHPDGQAHQADDHWAAATLLAGFLFEAEILPLVYMTEEDLLQIHAEVEAMESSVDLKELIDRHWIRIIGGIIEIPAVVRSGVLRYERIKEGADEYEFLADTKAALHPKTIILRSEFLERFTSYQEARDLNLSFERLTSIPWIEEAGENIKIHSLEYDKPVFEFKNELNFIRFLVQKKPSELKLVIPAERLIAIHQRHKDFYPETPTLEELATQQVIMSKGENYYLNLWHTTPGYWGTLSSKIGFLLFTSMKDSGRYPEKTTLFRTWLLKMHFINASLESPVRMSTEDRADLLSYCVKALLEEKDLVGPDKEVSRLVLSGRDFEFVTIANESKIGFPDLNTAGDLFELFNLMEECDDVHHSNLLWIQESRWFTTQLIQVVVFFDNRYAADGIGYSSIRQLLHAGMTRPYLLWKTCWYIHYWKPEIIPYLCLDRKVASLVFQLYTISKPDPSLSDQQAGTLLKENIISCFDLLLSGLLTFSPEQGIEKSVPVFECLITLAENKWKLLAKEQTAHVIEQQQQHAHELLDAVVLTLENKKLPGSYHNSDGEFHPLFFPEILADLFKQVESYSSLKSYPGGVVGLSLIKMDLLSILLSLVFRETYQKQHVEEKHLEDMLLVKAFLSEYLRAFNTSSVNKWDFTEAATIDAVPIWATHQQGLELIPWSKWLLLLENHGLLPEFLSPRGLSLKQTENSWDHYNHYTVQKIRKHVEILMLAHQGLKENEYHYKQEGYKVETAIRRLELAIADYIDKYAVNDTSNRRMDILSDRHERRGFGSGERALLPLIAQALNKFEPVTKTAIIKSLLQTDSLTKCLRLMEFLTSEADIHLIREQIKNFDVTAYLGEKNYIPEIETVVVKLAEFEEFIEKAQEALLYWEHRVLTQRDDTEYCITSFRLKLLIAYWEGDEDTIIQAEGPDLDSFSTSRGFEFNREQTRNFYLGLVKLKHNKPEAAYTIFNGLMGVSKTDKAAIAINRFYSHITIAKEVTDKSAKEKILSKALMEWESYETSIPKEEKSYVLENVQENLWQNKLQVFHQLRRDKEFDQLFLSLDQTFQLRKDFFEIRMSNFLRRQQYEQAKTFADMAKRYHQSTDVPTPEFIRRAIEQLEDEDDYRRLRKDYQDMITRTPENLVQILPENLVGKRNLAAFVLKEICSSANALLDNINSIDKIDLEDKYSDLLISGLANKFTNWYWSVGNSRGGFSASNKNNPGELDFIIRSADNDRIATCEALLLHGKDTSDVTSHLIKTFNYDHRRKLFFIIVYYNGNNAVKHWKDYQNNIIPNIQYPEDFPLHEAAEEIDENFTNNSVKALLAKHGEHTLVYHVFINLNYKIATGHG